MVNVNAYNPILRLPMSSAGRVVLVLALLAPVAFYLFDFRPVVSLAWFAGVAALLLLSHPRVAFGLFMLSLGFYVRAKVGPMMVLPADVAAAFVTAAITFEFLLRGYTQFRWTSFDLPFFGLIAATIVSIIFAFDVSYTLVPTLRIIVVYLAFRFFYKLGLEIGVRTVLLWYIYIVAALSAYNCFLFLAEGGQYRIFGPSWLAFETYSMTALPMALAFLIWSHRTSERIRFSLICLLIAIALIATQSRAPLVATMISIPAMVFFAARKRRREGNPIRIAGAMQVVVVAVIAGLVLLSFQQSIFLGWFERVERLAKSIVAPQGTIALRVVLWTAALKGFMTNPLTGIGIGNFKVIDQIIPEVKLVPVWYYIGGLSAHNVVLQYLAETGIIGAFSLVALAWTGVKTSFRRFCIRQSDSATQVSAALFIGMFVFAVTILYVRAWTWGLDSYVLSLIFGLNAAWHWRPRGTDRIRSRANQPAESNSA